MDTFYMLINIFRPVFFFSFHICSMRSATTQLYVVAMASSSYVHGIGSETRNSLFHLHNARDLILVTTCRHGKSWRELQDARCDEDNREYDR